MTGYTNLSAMPNQREPMVAPTPPFKTIATRIAWSCPWYRVRQDDIITPDGNPGTYNIIEKEDAVWIVPVTDDGYVVMVHQYRYTVDEWCWEIPAGGVKNGQTIEAAAHQELLEEVGGTTSRPVEYLGRFFLANGICNETGHIFLASGVEVGTPQHEPAEIMSVHLVPVTEALRMARSGEITDGPTALALLLCTERLAALTTDEP